MSNKVCIIYTSTNGLHQTYDNVSKKNMYGIARLIALSYSIGYYDKDNKYIEEKRVNKILTPKSITFCQEALKFHKISREEADKKGECSNLIIKNLKEELKKEKVKIIISHNLEFHLKTIQAECFRTCTIIDFSKYILIDTISFQHSYSYPKLVDLEKKLKVTKSKNTIDSISKVFGNLYSTYETPL
jgi:hypothetical protein